MSSISEQLRNLPDLVRERFRRSFGNPFAGAGIYALHEFTHASERGASRADVLLLLAAVVLVITSAEVWTSKGGIGDYQAGVILGPIGQKIDETWHAADQAALDKLSDAKQWQDGVFYPGISSPPESQPQLPVSNQIPTSPSQQNNFPRTDCGTYTIQAGENLTWIAKKHGVSVDAIAKKNNIPNPNLIGAGKTLSIPCPQNNISK